MRIDNQIITLDPFLIQRSPNGREFRVVGVEKDISVESQWIEGAEKFCWIVTVKFLDDSQWTKLHFDYQDECIKKVRVLKEILVEENLTSCRNRTLVQTLQDLERN